MRSWFCAKEQWFCAKETLFTVQRKADEEVKLSPLLASSPLTCWEFDLFFFHKFHKFQMSLWWRHIGSKLPKVLYQGAFLGKRTFLGTVSLVYMLILRTLAEVDIVPCNGFVFWCWGLAAFVPKGMWGDGGEEGAVDSAWQFWHVCHLILVVCSEIVLVLNIQLSPSESLSRQFALSWKSTMQGYISNLNTILSTN